MEGEIRSAQRQMDNATVTVGPEGFPQLTLYKVPKIEQVVLKDFDRNNFDQQVDRVDRCQTCHVAINREGFDDLPHPLKTHPKRRVFLGDSAHPPRIYGCTTCHDGQGEGINSLAQAHGTVKFWEHPLLEGENVQANCITCHLNVQGLEGAEVVGRGQQIFEQVGCTGCHLVEGYDDIPKVGPSLRRVRAKADPGWMVQWILNPRAFRPHTRMPHFFFKEDEALAAASYLWSASKNEADAWLKEHPAPEGYQSGDAAMVKKGAELARSLGCQGCHGLAEGEFTTRIAGKDLVPNLKDIAAKVNPRWAYNWLRDPKSYNPGTRMPSLRLSEDEALALTTYLMTLGTKPEPNAELVARLEQPANIARGEKLVRKYGCTGCHDIPGMEKESRIGVELTTFGSKPLEELFFGNDTTIKQSWKDWTFNKIHNPRVYGTERVEQLMPHFDLPKEDIESVKILLHGFVERKVPEAFKADHSKRARQIFAGRRKVQEYNCVGCHEINGDGGYIRKYYEKNPTLAPPVLNGEGEKVQANWLFGFLQNPENPIRPWLKVRMPTFGFDGPHADAFVSYFAALSEVEIPYVPLRRGTGARGLSGSRPEAVLRRLLRVRQLPPTGRQEARRAGGGLGSGPQPGNPAAESGLDREVDSRPPGTPAGNQDAGVLPWRTRGHSRRRREETDRGADGLHHDPRLEARHHRQGPRTGRPRNPGRQVLMKPTNRANLERETTSQEENYP